jgi:hypothetical protein
MTPTDFNDYVRSQTSPVIKQYGLKLVSKIDENTTDNA